MAVHPGHDPARWALPLIAEADDAAGGVWTLVEFGTSEAASLWLPPHAGEPCHGDTMRLGSDAPAGLPLCEAAAWLRARQDDYASANPSCWKRIVAARDAPWAPIVVAPFPVGDRTGPPDAAHIVVDGLHRALGWALRSSETRPVMSGDVREPVLRAYLAGPDLRAGQGRAVG